MKRIILVGCGASKRSHKCEARLLYTGRLFVARREHAERSGLPWFILSAKHGLVKPETVLEPYDKTMPTAAMAANRWAVEVMLELEELGHTSPMVLEIHAGNAYVRPIAELVKFARLNSRGPYAIEVEQPTRGLGIGQQIAWYATGQKPAAPGASPGASQTDFLGKMG